MPKQMGERAMADGAARRAREAEALRENLRRRKQQARSRAAGVAEEPACERAQDSDNAPERG